ncbi:MAG: threonine synthase, partial [Oceanicoccus sp.]
PAKFPEAVMKAGFPHEPELPHHMSSLFTDEERVHVIDNDLSKVHEFMNEYISS